MSRPRQHRKERGRLRTESQSLTRWYFLLPIGLAVVLNLPSLGLGYFWDDFYFLTFKGQGDIWSHLLPEAGADFYRPIPLGVYFTFLRLVDPISGVVGHLTNLVVLCGAVVLLVILVSDLAGSRAGLLSGLVFVSFGHVPGLVAWVSCSQDLFAIFFIVAAFLLRHRGRDLPALLCATAGLLSKEPAIAAFPVLVLWDWLLGRPTSRPWLRVAGYGAVAIGWMLIHPGIQQLADRGFQSGATGYVGLERSERWGSYLLRYVASLVNLPPPGLAASWWDERAGYGLVGAFVATSGAMFLSPRMLLIRSANHPSIPRIALLCALFVVPAVLMPTILLRHWSPYFACLPGLGVAILGGALLARQRAAVTMAVLAALVLLGTWYRGVRDERERILSERRMVESGEAMLTLRANFRHLFPKFAKGSQVVVSVGARGMRGVQPALFEGQALSLWYHDPTLRTVRTMKRRPDPAVEYLVRVTDNLDVIAIDPITQEIRTTSAQHPGLIEIDPFLLRYARAVAAAGDTDQAIGVVEALSRRESGDLIVYNQRLIASMLLAAGRRAEAESLMVLADSFPSDVARALLLRLVSEASPSQRLDDAAFEAFGLSATDPETIRWIMRRLWENGSGAQAAWFAERLHRLAPADPEAGSILARASALGIRPSREPGIRLAAPE